MALLASPVAYSPGAYSGVGPIDLRNHGALAHTFEMQYQRQLKTLQMLQKQAELISEDHVTWQERERRREKKYRQIEAERQVQHEERVEHGHRLTENRAAVMEAAARHEEEMRAAAAAKVQAVKDRLVRFAEERAEWAATERQRISGVEARRDATYRANLQLMEARRQAMLARERKVQDILDQREELRQLQLRIRAEEDYLRDNQRRTIKARADSVLEGRVAHFHAKQTEKDEYATRRKQDIEHLRRVRADELRQRFEYIVSQATEAAQVAESERRALSARLDGKAARGEALAGQRQALLDEMQRLRQQMQQHEEVVRASLLRMRQKGSVALPEEVVRSLQALRQGGPLRAGAMLGGARGGSRPLAIEYRSGGGGGSGGGAGSSRTPRPPQRAAAQQAGAGARSGSKGGGGGAGYAGRRPQSAASTPHIARSASRAAGLGGERSYLTSMISPRVGQPGKSRRLGGAGRPLSASADFRRSATAASPATPTRASTATMAPSASPYAPYTFPAAAARSRARPPTVEEQVAAATSTAELAAKGAARGDPLGRAYAGVHEVGRPGSRRESELRAVLQEEIAKEGERQAVLGKVSDDAERARLVKYFTIEREEAKRRILALSNAAQAALYH